MSEHKDNSVNSDIGCLQAIDALYAYLDGELDDPDTTASFERHIQHCRSCYSRAEVESLLTKRVRAAAKSQASAALQARLRHLMDNF
jgi:anti-sigma factor (TIGR02949 family)